MHIVVNGVDVTFWVLWGLALVVAVLFWWYTDPRRLFRDDRKWAADRGVPVDRRSAPTPPPPPPPQVFGCARTKPHRQRYLDN